MNMELLNQLINLARPAPYEPGEPMFWTDPHISRQMLKAHLDQGFDGASYRFERIDAICVSLMQRLKLKQGSRVADLGCGPGLYSARLADAGCRVMGLDFSATAIDYARGQSTGKRNPPEYRVGNYLQWHETACYDAVLLIYEDYGVLSPQERRKLLANIHGALCDSGAFVLDVASLSAFHGRSGRAAKDLQALPSGFWRPHPHLVLEEHYLYETVHATCDRYIVADGEVKDYRVYQTYYSPQSITCEMENAGFRVEELQSGLFGGAWREDSAQIGVLCRKA
jgi:SAM-dependent methyltransferase